MWLWITGIGVWVILVAAFLVFFKGAAKVSECHPRADHE